MERRTAKLIRMLSGLGYQVIPPFGCLGQELFQFPSRHASERGKTSLHGVPDQGLIDGVIFVPVDVTGRRNRGPINFTVPACDLRGEPPWLLRTPSPDGKRQRIQSCDPRRKPRGPCPPGDGVDVQNSIAKQGLQGLQFTTSPEPSRISLIWIFRRAYSKIPIGRSGSGSTSTSMSLSGRASFRATEPNTAACPMHEFTAHLTGHAQRIDRPRIPSSVPQSRRAATPT